MPRKHKIAASALNIRLHPHTAQRYVEWLEAIFARKQIAQVHGDRHGMISMLDRSELTGGILSGIITTFVKLDDTGSWFNTEKLTEATDAQVQSVVIPRNLYPNSASFYFYFDSVEHKLYFQTYSSGKTFTPGSSLRFFSALARDIEVSGKYGEAKISIVQEKASLDKLFGIKRIKEIQITILRPNTDIFDDDFEAKIEAHLEESHSREISINYKSEPGASITPTEEIRQISGVALENGNVKVIGRDEKGAVTMNSDEFPKELHNRYDPEAQSERAAFLSLIPARKKTAN
ncbi:MAG: DUF4747 family protein [Mesorhizobium sp.]|nr:MAG: DUF4747 family protein [Mesorhizobium sp.]